MARNDLFVVRVTDEERQIFGKVAAELSVPASEACRLLFHEAARQLGVLPTSRVATIALSKRESNQPANQ